MIQNDEIVKRFETQLTIEAILSNIKHKDTSAVKDIRPDQMIVSVKNKKSLMEFMLLLELRFKDKLKHHKLLGKQGHILSEKKSQG